MDSYLWKARAYYRQVAGLLSLGAVSGIICNVSVVLPAMFLGRTIDATLSLGQGRAALASLVRATLFYVAGTALYFLARIGKRWWLRVAVRRTIASVQNDALRGVLAWPMARLHQEPVGEIMSRIIGDAQVFGSGFNETTTELLDTWLFSVSLTVAMISYDPLLTLLAMAPVPLALVLAYLSRQWVRGRTRAVRVSAADLTTALQERLAGVRVLRLFGSGDYAVRRVEALSLRLKAASLAETRLQMGLQPVYSILVTAGVVLVVWLGGRRVIDGILTTGGLVAFMQLYLRFVLRGHRLPLFFNRLQSAGVAWERLEPYLAESLPVEGEPPWASFRPAHVMGLLAASEELPVVASQALTASLQDVTFRYPGGANLALDGLSLDVPAGNLVAVTGPVGSGKSALLRLLLGLYEPDRGSVWVGDGPVSELPLPERAARIGYLPQDPGLFSGTVIENMGLADEDEDTHHVLDRVVSIASLGPDLAQFPNGPLTQIGEGGVQISGGQRQRIALARALAIRRDGPPALLLLDDPFASVDVDTEGRIVRALREAFGPLAPPDKRATMVICSHRLAAFQHADKVVVLDRGRVVAEGTHDELLAQGGVYARIYRAQHQIQGSGTMEAGT